MRMKPDDPKDLLRRLASIALVVATACSVTGWAYTARELNAITAYQPVGGKALRLARPWQGPAGHVPLARGEAGRAAAEAVLRPASLEADQM